MRTILLTSLLALLATAAFADCVNVVTMNEGEVGGHIFLGLDTGCGQATNINKGDAVTIASDTKQVSGTVAAIKQVNQGNVHFMRVDLVAGAPASEDAASLESFPSGAVTVTYNGTTVKADLDNGAAVNAKRYSWSVGPASQADNGTTGAANGTSSSTALRLQYDGEYIQNGFFGRTTSEAKFETRATMKIDTTTTNKAGFVDDNEAAFALRSLKLKLPGLNQVHIGLQGQLSKAAHQDIHDGAVTATFSTWVPEVPTITIFSSVPDYIAPPLTLDLSYGYKNKQTATDTMHGRGGTGTAAYRLYVWDKYEVAASEIWTLNDFSNRPATVPRTQRMFKVQISYLESPATGFKVAASYENGSIGPVLTQVKQFFLGIAVSKFSFSGSSLAK